MLTIYRKYSETEHKPQPYLSEAQTAPPLVICTLSLNSSNSVDLLLTWLVSCIDFRVSVETLLNIKSEGEELNSRIAMVVKC